MGARRHMYDQKLSALSAHAERKREHEEREAFERNNMVCNEELGKEESAKSDPVPGFLRKRGPAKSIARVEWQHEIAEARQQRYPAVFEQEEAKKQKQEEHEQKEKLKREAILTQRFVFCNNGTKTEKPHSYRNSKIAEARLKWLQPKFKQEKSQDEKLQPVAEERF